MLFSAEPKGNKVTSITIMINGEDEKKNNISISNHHIRSLADAHKFLEGVKVMWDIKESK